MFIYFCRLYDKYGIDGSNIESIAIFLQKITHKKYNRFTFISGDTKLVFDYLTYSIFQETKEALYENRNPFSLVILASQEAVKKDTDAKQLLAFKREFTQMAIDRNYSEFKIAALLQFVYYAIKLPETEEKEFNSYLFKIIKPDSMTTLQTMWNNTWENYMSENIVFANMYNKRVEELRGENEKIKRQNQEAQLREQIAIQKEVKAIRKEKEAKQKEEEARQEKEEAKRKEEAIILKSVIKFTEKGFSPEEISKCLEIPIKKVNDILDNE